MIVTIGDDGQIIVNKFSETPDVLSDTILIDIHNFSFTFSKIGHIQLCHSHIRQKSEEVSTDSSARQPPSKELAAHLKAEIDRIRSANFTSPFVILANVRIYSCNTIIKVPIILRYLLRLVCCNSPLCSTHLGCLQ